MTLYDNFLTPKIIDNALPQTYADEIEELLYSNRFAWYYTDNLTTKDIRRSGFYHEYYRLGTIHSNHYNFIKIIPHIVTNKADIKQKFDIMIARSFLHTPNAANLDFVPDGIHIDTPDPHIVCLYYVNTSDGPTRIYGTSKTDLEVMSIEPVKNRAVLFNGQIYHSSTSPKKDQRAIINFNLRYDT